MPARSDRSSAAGCGPRARGQLIPSGTTRGRARLDPEAAHHVVDHAELRLADEPSRVRPFRKTACGRRPPSPSRYSARARAGRARPSSRGARNSAMARITPRAPDARHSPTRTRASLIAADTRRDVVMLNGGSSRTTTVASDPTFAMPSESTYPIRTRRGSARSSADPVADAEVEVALNAGTISRA